MSLRVKKQEKENSQSLIRRFTKSIKQSGILLEARKSLFLEKEKSREMKKRSALRREMLKREYERLKKLGKI